MKRFKIACIFGTRPEIIKMAPVIMALQSMPEYFIVENICTGQHRELLVPLMDWFNLDATKNMCVMHHNQALNELCARILMEFSAIFKVQHYDYIIGQGDTTTVFAAALAAFHAKIPFAHVEAGLRTFDRHFPFPEEMNRVLVSRLASLHFAPTEISAQNLRNEGVPREQILITGNTVIDALYYTVERLNLKKQVAPSSSKTILVTTHRRENHGTPLLHICKTIRRVALERKDVRFIFTVHPNPNVQTILYEQLNYIENIDLVEPMSYEQLVATMQTCYMVLTDSGGLQEEAPALMKPVLILREKTERPEVVELGGAKLVGSDETSIYHWITTLLDDNKVYQQMIIGASPYGDGAASLKIVNHLRAQLTRNSSYYREHDLTTQLSIVI